MLVARHSRVFYYIGEDMNITGSPIPNYFQMKDSAADLPSQQAAASTKSVSTSNESMDNQKTQVSYQAPTAGQKQQDEGAVRTKRGLKFPKAPKLPTLLSPKKPKLPPSNGTPGKYIQTASLGPRRPAGPPNSPGVTKFKDIVYKTQHPGSSVTGPATHAVAKPKTFGDVANNLIVADRLVKAGVFKTNSSLKTVTRDAFVNASVNGLVSAPLSIGTYAGSIWTGETIKGSFTANTPVLPPVHQPALNQATNTAAAVSSTGGQDDAVIKLRLENAELKTLYAVNTIQAIVEGGDGKALEKSPTWPTGTNERLDVMEKLYDAAEKNMVEVSEKNDFIYRPYKDDSAVVSKDASVRLDTLDKRYEHLNTKGIGRLVTVREVEEKKKNQTV
ncbi:hypothetical protein [Pseudomonas brenneri]